MTIRRLSDNLVRLKGPTNASSGAVLSAATVNFTVYDERKEMRVAPFKTRARQEAAAAATAIEIPFWERQPLESGDLIWFVDEKGVTETRTLTAVTPTTDKYTTLGFSGGLTNAVESGAEIHLLRKATTSLNFPVHAVDLLPEINADSLVFELRTMVLSTAVTVDYIAKEQALELEVGSSDSEGPIAKNQDETTLLTINGGLGTAVDINARILTQVTGQTSMSLYGTAVAGNDDWGYEGTITDTTRMYAGQRLRVEIEIDGGAGLKRVDHLIEQVIE